MHRVKRMFVGGSAGNEQLTAVLATILILLLASGAALALATLPGADRLQDRASSQLGFDGG